MNEKSDFVSGTNKCQFVINGINAELVRLERFLKSKSAFLFVGHTKIDPDKVFAMITNILKSEDCFNLL